MSAIYAHPLPRSAPQILKPGTAPLVMKSTRAIALWSDPATWEGRVPQAGATVVIPAGGRVLVDTTPPPLAGLQVDGRLWFDDGALTLTAQWIMVRGELRVGAPGRPANGPAQIILAGLAGSRAAAAARFLAVLDGGLVTLCGEWRAGRSTLAASVEPGAREIVLTHLTDWQPGDHIVIGLTDTPAHLAEERIVAAVDGSVLRLDAPLRYPHWGGLPAWPGALVEGRAEVGLLTRNVRVTGAGGYLLVMPDGRLHLENVELTGLGHREHPPIHLDPASGPDALRMVGSSLHHNQRPAAALFEGHPHRRHQNVIYDHA